MLTVYLYDGTPIDIFNESDMPENSTTIRPTDGLYQPRKFDPDTQTWSGATKEEWESSLPVEPPYPISAVEAAKNAEIDDMKGRIEELERLIQELLQGTV